MRYLKYAFGILLLLQIPFLYGSCQSWQVRRYLDSLKRVQPPQVPFRDLRGTVHVHSAAGGHSLGTYPEIIEAARRLNYAYVLITEHERAVELYRPLRDSDILMIYGQEQPFGASMGLLTVPDSQLKILTDFAAELPADISGVEIYNMHENGEAHNSLYNWGKFLYHRLGYSDLFFFHLWDVNREKIEIWNRALQSRRLAALAGNDAHQNIGVLLQTTSGRRLASVMLDPYLESLRFVTNRVLLNPNEEITEQNVLKALAAGSCYIAFEGIADATGFSFHAITGDGTLRKMGESIRTGAKLHIQSPLPVRFEIFHSGTLFHELEGTQFTVEAAESGFYRVEVYLIQAPGLLADKPWIITNPIYVQ